MKKIRNTILFSILFSCFINTTNFAMKPTNNLETKATIIATLSGLTVAGLSISSAITGGFFDRNPLNIGLNSDTAAVLFRTIIGAGLVYRIVKKRMYVAKEENIIDKYLEEPDIDECGMEIELLNEINDDNCEPDIQEIVIIDPELIADRVKKYHTQKRQLTMKAKAKVKKNLEKEKINKRKKDQAAIKRYNRYKKRTQIRKYLES